MYTRHTQNQNLFLVYGNSYREMPILEQYTPMIKQYLDRTYDVLYRALTAHGRITAYRIDLHYPANEPLPECAYNNKPITSFIKAVRDQIDHNRRASALRFNRVNDTEIHYIWCREIGITGRPHYHVYILVNAASYNVLGNWIKGRNNMGYRFISAWANAIGMDVEKARGLVQFPSENALHVVSRNDAVGIGLLYQHMSYLCKAYSKQYGGWLHSFDYSH